MNRLFIKRNAEKLILILAAISALLSSMIVFEHMETAGQAELQRDLADKILRFHVIANSDSDADQQLKLLVRDGVMTYLEKEMPRSEDASAAAGWAREHTEEIEAAGRRALEQAGADFTVNAAVTTCFFSDRTYDRMLFPAGNYEALRVEIGAAQGHNWWGVLYPELCFLDCTNIVEENGERQKLKNVLTEEEYSDLSAASDFQIGWFFR